jgi:hypothetical protein
MPNTQTKWKDSIMDSQEQLKLIREFMVQISGATTAHTLRLVKQDLDHKYIAAGRGLGETPSEAHLVFVSEHAAAQNALLTMRMAMHLAAEYGRCHDTFHGSLEKTIQATAPERETSGSNSEVCQSA